MRFHGRFSPRTLAIVTLVAAVILLSIVALPQWFSKQARLEVLRSHVGQVARLAASVVNGDVHRQLLEPGGYSVQRYEQALQPLVRFHSANPEIFYVYTMVDRNGETFFVLDTASSPQLKNDHELRASKYMERFELREEYKSDWLQQLAAGRAWINPSFEEDDYGTFLSAHAPIYDSQGRYSGFVGVDFDLQYYLAQEARFMRIRAGSIIAALLAALIIGYIISLYHFDLHRRLEEHYRFSMRDDLTGLLNRRGALEAITKTKLSSSCATLLVDIDDLKKINDSRGHAAGDAVIGNVAQAIRESIREGDDCARLGGDEFMVFAPNCDAQGASEMALRILSRVAAQADRLGGLRHSVSVGIAVQSGGGAADFDAMYHDADAALYHAKARGKHRFAMFEPFMMTELQPQRRA